MKRRTLDLTLLGVCLVWAAVVLPRMVTGRWSEETELVLIVVGGLLRLALLLVASTAAVGALRVLGRDNPARVSQSFLAGGFCTYFVAQVALFGLTIASGGSPPYPSAADLGFMTAMFFLITGVALAIRAWLAFGLFPDGGRQAAVAGVCAAVPLSVGVVWTIRSLGAADVPAMQVAADVAYPVLDSTLLILTFAMLRLAMLMGRGLVGVMWRSLLVGFLAMAVGDVVYSFFAGFDLQVLDPVLDLLYTLSYALLARGALLQLRLLRD
jgi:hypothetical protein